VKVTQVKPATFNRKDFTPAHRKLLKLFCHKYANKLFKMLQALKCKKLPTSNISEIFDIAGLGRFLKREKICYSHVVRNNIWFGKLTK
jgi:hypothetical protein